MPMRRGNPILDGRGNRRSRGASSSWFPVTVVAYVLLFLGIDIFVYRRLEMDKTALRCKSDGGRDAPADGHDEDVTSGGGPSSLPVHLLPHVPVLPALPSRVTVADADARVGDLLAGRPTMAGVVALLQRFVSDLRGRNRRRAKAGGDGKVALADFYGAAAEHLAPFDEAYRGRSIFQVREDGSIFISVAAFREHILDETLESAFSNAKNPDRIFVGAVIQNCFGKEREDGSIDTSGRPCQTGPMQVGTKANGKKITKRLDVPPDRNGIEDFCLLPGHQKYCENGQIRVLYMHHTDGLGPSMARYFASKLWGGENFFMQIDSHLRFGKHWDAKYIEDVKLTRNYPRSVLSTYPPGFDPKKPFHQEGNAESSSSGVRAASGPSPTLSTVEETPGTRLCGCGIPHDGKDGVIRINMGVNMKYRGNESRPTQQPFLGAGYVFFHGSFLEKIPYDPYLPWTFMGEEILLSIRAWTSGWNIYAPRRNLINHQYRPGVLGIPKFVSAVNEGFEEKKGVNNGWLQKHTIRRIKNLCGYPLHTVESIEHDEQAFVLTDREHYDLGTERSWDDFLDFAQVRVNHTSGALDCLFPRGVPWCNEGLRE